jgi:hypothetical protein
LSPRCGARRRILAAKFWPNFLAHWRVRRLTSTPRMASISWTMRRLKWKRK